MFKIAINAGHGLYTAGKRCLKNIDSKETREWKLNSRIVSLVIEKLKTCTEYEILRLDDPTGKTDIPLKTRTDKANAWGANVYISVHHNAGVGGKSGGGIMVYTYTKVDQATKDLQKKMYDSLIKHTGLKGNRSNPLGQADLHECRETKMPAIIIEDGFMDSTTDTPIILTDKFAESSANAIVDVLADIGKLTKKVQEDIKPTSKPEPVKPVQPTKPTIPTKINVTYQIWDDRQNKWLPNVVNTSDYAGVFGNDVCAVYANLSSGNIYYKVHTKGGKWLPEVKNRTDYAGIFNKPIDGLMMKTDTGKTVHYQVHIRKTKKWLPYVTGYNEKGGNNGYAGIIGQEIDAVRIYID